MSDGAPDLRTLRLIVVTGKGGVGKSVVAGALARRLAREGRRVLTLEVDPRENLHHLFDVPPSGGEIAEVESGLWLQNLKPSQVVDWVVERQVKIGFLVERIRKSPVYHRFVEGAPGLEQIAVLGHVHRLLAGRVDAAPALDTVVLDAPATGHGLFLLTAPGLFAASIREGPFAELAREVDGLVSDPARTGVVVVTLAEEMPVQEAIELRAGLRDQTVHGEPALLVVNGLYPPLPDEASGPELSLWRDRRIVNEGEMERLDAEWSGLRVDLPLVAVDAGPELLRRLEVVLGDRLREGAAWT